MSLITLLVIIIIILFVYKICTPSSKLWYYGNKIPGPKAYPVIGNSLSIFTSKPLLQLMNEFSDTYGSIFRLWLGKQLFIMLIDPNDVEVFLSTTKFLDKSDSYRFLDSWLGKTNLLTSDGNIWQRHRKLLTPSFHFKILENSVAMIIQNVRILCEKLEEQIDRPEFHIESYIEKCSLDIISETAMGIKLDTQTSENTVYLDCIKNVCVAAVKRMFCPVLHPEFLFQISTTGRIYYKNLRLIKEQVYKVITERKNLLEENNKFFSQAEREGRKQLRPFLDFLLTESSFTDEEIEDEVQTFMFAGHDTTKTAISFCLCSLANHQDVQTKVYQEIKDVLLNKEEPSYQDLFNMKYLDCVIKESMRLHATVPMFSRKVHEDITLPSGYFLPAGTLVNFNSFYMHRNEKYFPEPLKFLPERFLQRDETRNQFAYIPFSAGPRNCIGQKFAMLELKITISMLVLKFQLLPAIVAEPPILETALVLRSLNELSIRLKRRNNEDI